MRARDIEQLEQIAGNFRSRSPMLTRPDARSAQPTRRIWPGPPLREEDYLILSTIHSAKGCEWDAVYVIHAADGNIPSDMATGSDEQVEEERRLFYVALTRARDFLEVCVPLRYYHKKSAVSDRHSYAQMSRFLSKDILDRFERVSLTPPPVSAVEPVAATPLAGEIRRKISAMWS